VRELVELAHHAHATGDFARVAPASAGTHFGALYALLEVALDRLLPLAPTLGTTGVLRLPARCELVGRLVWRKLLLFTHRLRAGT
jgi:hypothetical protein